MNVCFGYEEMSDKKKLAVLDKLIADFRSMLDPAQGITFGNMISDLETERAEVASRIGKTK